jgi:23S rRNA (uracil1939-C5)-methyltransferase
MHLRITSLHDLKKCHNLRCHPRQASIRYLACSMFILIFLKKNDAVAFQTLLPIPVFQSTTTSREYQNLYVKSNTDNDGDNPKSYLPHQKRKLSSLTNTKKGNKVNKPRSKATKVVNRGNSIDNNNQNSMITTKRMNKSVIAPPLIVDYVTNNASNHEEQDHRLRDNSIETNCIHYSTCSGCTVGRDVGNTNVVRAAQRYFAIERYDGKKSSDRSNAIDSIESYPVVIPTPTTQWRTQAKLAVASKSSSTWSNTGCIFGLYEKGSHVVSPIPQCIVHHPSINKAIELLEQATAKTGTVAYSDTGQQRDGDLRYVQLQVERITGHVCLTLVYNAATLKECQPSLARLIKELTKRSTTNESQTDDNSKNDNANHIWHSIWCHCNDGVRNNIFSRSPGRWHRLVGPEFMREPIPVENTKPLIMKSTTNTAISTANAQAIAAGWLYFSPLTFRQGNLDGFDILALHVARTVPMGSKVCELYGGVGVLGLTCLAYHYYNSKEPMQWLRCSDENPANVRCFDRSVESLTLDMTLLGRQDNRPRSRYSNNKSNTQDDAMTIGKLAQMMESGQSYTEKSNQDRKKVSYMIASAGKALQSGQALGANVLIVDPPRKGLEDDVLIELCKPYNPDQPYVESPTMLSISDDQVNWVNDVRTLIYVSCGFDALANDCDRLLSNRLAKWKLQSTTGYILFPGSDHVETIAIFQR